MNLPKTIKSAANCLIVTGLHYLAFPIIIHLYIQKTSPELLQNGIPMIAVIWLAVGLLLLLSAFLLYRGKKEGTLLWWICSPVVFLTFPLGTILGIFISKYVLDQKTSSYFANAKNPAFKPIILD